MHITELQGKKIAILGFGVESQETVEFLLKHGGSITVFDEKNETHFDASRIAHLRNEGVRFHFGEFLSLTDFDIIARSPGVRPGIQELHEAGDLGIPITSATNLFFEHAKGMTIGITGTKGKGTTAALLYEILKAADKKVFLGGNIGIPALSFVDKLTSDSITILELSSFQLMDAEYSPDIAIVLMVTQDHMDYHTSLDEYITAKMGMTRNQKTDDMVIVNIDYPASVRITERSVAKRFEITRRTETLQGCFIKNNSVVTVLDGSEKKIVDTKDIGIPGQHNFENVCAAVMAGLLLNIPETMISETVKNFKGLPHRLELIRDVNGVRYYNDSISTTPDSAIAAINAFNAPEILILGGSTKHSDFTELGSIISDHKNIKAIIGVGDEWQNIKKSVGKTSAQIIEGYATMHDIVDKASAIAEKNDVVILSPACASFDMFKDYKDRGDQFRKEVEKL